MKPTKKPATKPRGRPPIAQDERLEQRRSIRLTAAQWQKIDAYGLDWLRKLIARAKPPKRSEPPPSE